jgi:Rieske Fe-S protein
MIDPMVEQGPNRSRREALKTAGGLLACGSGAFAVVHYLTRHDPRASETVAIGPLAGLPIGSFEKRIVRVTEEGVWTTGPVEKTLWILRNTDDSLLVFSGTCPHMNCVVSRREDQHFECPCHRSSFASDGTVVSGPSPRSLDTLAYSIEDGVVRVQFHNFQKGIAEKRVVP